MNDPIDVAVEFSDRKVKPKKMRWGTKIYDFNAVNLVHTAREGQKRIYYFSVSDRANFMKLKLDTDTLEWRLVEVYTP
jgi:hypothetical protein